MEDKLEVGFIYVAILVFFSLLVTAIVLSARADGKVDYCTIDATTHSEGPTVNYVLQGHVPWRPNRTLGRFSSFEETLSSAAKLNCEVR